MKIIMRIIGVIILLCCLLFVGTCAWQNCRNTETYGPEPPAIEKAGYTVIVKATGQKYYTPKVTATETAPRVITVYTYWERVDDGYIFHDITLPLDERIFGIIEVKKR